MTAMRVLVAGGAGAIGRLLVPLLVSAGHDVAATTRRPERVAGIEAQGAQAVLLDALDASATAAVVDRVRPDAVVHQLTDLADWDYAGNARLRTVGTRNLVDAARAAGVTRMVAQSIAWVVEPGDGPSDESTPLDPTTDPARRATLDAVRTLESALTELPGGVVLRYGWLYGPGTAYARDGLHGRSARAGELVAAPTVMTFLHVEDAARAAVAALDWPGGIVNVVDDHPARGDEWAPAFAHAVGAPEPPRADGPPGRVLSNARLHELGFTLAHPDWREGFRTL
jgi:nucleoside-diphosphate-sugar epimerase